MKKWLSSILLAKTLEPKLSDTNSSVDFTALICLSNIDIFTAFGNLEQIMLPWILCWRLAVFSINSVMETNKFLEQIATGINKPPLST